MSKSAKKRKSKKLFRNILILCLSLVLLVAGAGCIYADHMLGRINFIEDTTSKVETAPIFKSNDGGLNAKSGLLGGLYHDDAITNILVMGVDNYQPNDPEEATA